MSCVIGAFHANYPTNYGSSIHDMGIKDGGKTAILAGVGPMGLAAIDYTLHCDRKPGMLVVTDIDEERLARAACLHSPEEAKKNGIDLRYINTGQMNDPVKELRDITGSTGYDDVFVFAPVKSVVEQADQILGFDGCLNFFAGPANPEFKAEMNFYNVHYAFTHLVGTSGGNTDDMREALQMMAEGKVNPAGMITHIGGLDAVIDTTLNLPDIPGGKKLIYTNVSLPLTAIKDFKKKGAEDPFFMKLYEIIKKTDGLWNKEAEDFVIQNANKI
jgi:threonine dehydrogenase-like Zn-dependent dehydrogenase